MEQRGNDQPWWSGNASRGYWAWHEFAPDSPSATAAQGEIDGAQDGRNGADDEPEQQHLDGDDEAGIGEEQGLHNFDGYGEAGIGEDTGRRWRQWSSGGAGGRAVERRR